MVQFYSSSVSLARCLKSYAKVQTYIKSANFVPVFHELHLEGARKRHWIARAQKLDFINNTASPKPITKETRRLKLIYFCTGMKPVECPLAVI